MEELKNENVVLSGDQAGEQQYLTFIMSGEEYGVDILAVQEIRGWEEPTLIPNSPGYIRGVINLRGTIVPIMDLRLRFGLREAGYTATTVVIILIFDGTNGERGMGSGVDAV
ncbi:MAG: chemotaxis protein CheW, partial [Thalassolituus sp.]